MTRETSIEAFHKIKEEGLLSQRRFEVYSVLFHRGPLTAGEVWRVLSTLRQVQLNSVSPRMAELERLKVIREVGKRKCSVTGQTCLVWDVTNNLPAKKPKYDRLRCATCDGKGYLEQGKLF